MGVVFTKESNYAIEMRKWEAHHTEFGAPMRPYVFREFPKRLSKAARTDKGIVIVEAFDANDENEERNLKSRGFHFGQEQAIKAIELQQTEYGTLAAEREYAIQHGRLSERAANEVRAAEAAHGASHLPDLPAPKKRGRRPKAAIAPSSEL